MYRELSLALTLLSLLSLPFSNAAIAGVGDNVGGVVDLFKRTSPMTRAQYDTSSDGDYCWYDQGWRGPGWYLCDDEWDNGLGWGGPYGWNGWGGGHRHRHRHFYGTGAARPGTPIYRRVHGPVSRVGGINVIHRSPSVHAVRPGFHSGQGPMVHGFAGAGPTYHSHGGPGPSFHSYGGASGAVPNATHSLAAPATAAPAAASPGFGGEASHGFGGGASFPSAAHSGGMGH